MNSSSVYGFVLKGNRNITIDDINRLFPHGYTVDRVTMNGTGLFNVLHASIMTNMHPNNSNSSHLVQHHNHFQLSGIKVIFNNDPENPQVESIQVACGEIEKECSPIQIKKWCQVNWEQNYTVALSSEFTGKDGDGIGIHIK